MIFKQLYKNTLDSKYLKGQNWLTVLECHLVIQFWLAFWLPEKWKRKLFLFQQVGWTIKQEMMYYNILAFPPVMWLRICHWPEDDLAIFMETEAGIPTSCCALIPAPYGLQGRHSLPLHLSPPLSLSWSIIANSFVYLRASDMSAFLIIFFQMISSIGFFPHLIQIQIFSWNISIIKKK